MSYSLRTLIIRKKNKWRAGEGYYWRYAARDDNENLTVDSIDEVPPVRTNDRKGL
jgi:hypothetical protein